MCIGLVFADYICYTAAAQQLGLVSAKCSDLIIKGNILENMLEKGRSLYRQVVLGEEEAKMMTVAFSTGHTH